MPSLPLDIIINIICRLPGKTLVCFKCVSKSWNSLISSPYFINHHLTFSIESNNVMLVVRSRTPFSEKLYCIDWDSLDVAPSGQELGDPLKNAYCYSADGSCNGWLALYQYKPGQDNRGSLVFWNPSIDRSYDAPSSTICLDPSLLNTLQFDTYSNDYRVVAIRKNSFQKSSDLYRCSSVQKSSDLYLYSLKARCWRKIRCSSRYFNQNHGHILFNGALHCLTLKEDKSIALVAFDLGVEEFYELPLPISSDGVHCRMKLRILERCLCLTSIDQHGGFDLWMMKEYKVKESWTKLFYIQKLGVGELNDLHVLAYSKNHHKVLVEINSCDLFWYDLRNARFTEIPIRISGLLKKNIAYTICPASLVSIDANVGAN